MCVGERSVIAKNQLNGLVYICKEGEGWKDRYGWVEHWVKKQVGGCICGKREMDG